jgi:hypothetical protein
MSTFLLNLAATAKGAMHATQTAATVAITRLFFPVMTTSPRDRSLETAHNLPNEGRPGVQPMKLTHPASLLECTPPIADVRATRRSSQSL